MSAGVITTPGVAYLARTLPADAGVVISASHNPYHDNGIKIFAPTGRKLDDATERLIESDIYAEFESGVTARRPRSLMRVALKVIGKGRRRRGRVRPSCARSTSTT